MTHEPSMICSTALGMINHITFPMHKQGHTLNLFIEEENSPLIMKVIRGHLISDHHFIHSHLNICKNKPKVKDVTYRKYKQIDKIAFKEDLQRSLEVEHATHDLRSLVTRYNSDPKEVLDRHASEKRRLVKVTHKQPWFTDKICSEIILRKAKEWKWLLQLYGLLLPKMACCKHHPASQEGILLNTP